MREPVFSAYFMRRQHPRFDDKVSLLSVARICRELKGTLIKNKTIFIIMHHRIIAFKKVSYLILPTCQFSNALNLVLGICKRTTFITNLPN